MPDKKTSPSKTAAKSAARPADKAKASQPRRERAEAPPKAASGAARPNSKATPAKPAPAKAVKAAKPTPAAKSAKAPTKAPPPKTAAKDKAAVKVAPKPDAKAKTMKPAPVAKLEPKAKAEPKPAPQPVEKPAAKPEAAVKAVKTAPETLAKPAPQKPAPVEAVAKPEPKPVAAQVEAPRQTLAAPKPAPIPPAPKAPPKPLAKPIAAPVEEPVELKPVPAFKGSAPASGAKNPVLVGAVAGAFGVKGEIRVRSFTVKSDGVVAYGPLYDSDGKILLRPKAWRETKDGVVISAPEVKTREEAEALKGQRLYIPRAHLPDPKDEDEFYIVDLLGCSAETVDGAVLGEVVAVWNFGAGDIIEFKPPQGQNVRVSFTKETVPLVDLAHRRVVIDPPAPEPVN